MWSKTPRAGETALATDPATLAADAGIVFIGHVETPWKSRSECPRNSRGSREICRVVLKPDYLPGLKSVETCSHLVLLYWMHEARRDLIVQAPSFADTTHGCFALRTPVRPNPVSLSVVEFVGMTPDGFRVRGLDCLDGTPLVDIKPYFATTDSVPDAVVGWRKGLGGRAVPRATVGSGPIVARDRNKRAIRFPGCGVILSLNCRGFPGRSVSLNGSFTKTGLIDRFRAPYLPDHRTTPAGAIPIRRMS
jgi:tRNA-Thr(GGU) m(6)t(6)A37 methyltransferase TsaA